MNDSLKVSIITPSYNYGAFLEQTLQSVRDQDYDNIEHIVIDGGSQDDSLQVIHKFADDLAYWVSEPDGGLFDALEKGFARATGEIVAWQNADDYYEPNVFGEVMKVFAEHPEVDIVFGNVRVVDVNDRLIGEMRLVPATSITMLLESYTMHNQAAFFRRALWDRMGGINREIGYNFDFDLLIRANLSARRTYFIHRVLGIYRMHGGSITFSGKAASNRTDSWAIRRRYLGRWGTLPRVVFQPLVWLLLLRRAWWYMRLGDWDYLVEGFRKRVIRQKPRYLGG